MEKKYIFAKNQWNSENFMYVYSPICKTFKTFIQEDNAIVNEFCAESGDFDYISMVTKEKYAAGAKISAVCSFEKFGAPLIVITDDISETGENKRYGLHFEIVAYEEGVNVWRIVPWPERTERPIKPALIGQLKFEIKENESIDIEVEVKDKAFEITVNGNCLSVKHEEIPNIFHAGITACEGINRFSSFTVERG